MTHARHASSLAMSAFAGMAMCLAPAPSLAQDASTPAPTRLDTLIVRLDDDSFQIRQRATQELLSDTTLATIDEDELIGHLTRDDLAPEQRARLRAVYERWFVRAMDHGGMGVSFASGGSDAPQVLIFTTREGFPCHDKELLFPYDAIVEIDGVDVKKITDKTTARWNAAEEFMRSSIISRRAGESVRLVVKRPPDSLVRELPDVDRLNRGTVPAITRTIDEHPETETVTIDLPLGSYSQLGNPTPLPHRAIIDRAISMRLTRKGAGELTPTVIRDHGVEEDEWRRHTRQPNHRNHNDILSALADPNLAVALNPEHTLVENRRPVGIPPRLEGNIQRLRPGGDPVVEGNNRGGRQIVRIGGEFEEPARETIEQLQRFNRVIDQLSEKIARQRDIAGDDTLSDRERFLAGGRLAELEKQRDAAKIMQARLISNLQALQELDKEKQAPQVEKNDGEQPEEDRRP